MQVIACASLFLGGKVEETPKALRDVLKAMCNVRFADSPRQLERVLVCAQTTLLVRTETSPWGLPDAATMNDAFVLPRWCPHTACWRRLRRLHTQVCTTAWLRTVGGMHA